MPDSKDALTNSHQSLINLVWSAIGAAIAMGLALWIVADDSSLFLLASLRGLGVLILFLTAVVWSRMRPGKRYPIKWWRK